MYWILILNGLLLELNNSLILVFGNWIRPWCQGNHGATVTYTLPIAVNVAKAFVGYKQGTAANWASCSINCTASNTSIVFGYWCNVEGNADQMDAYYFVIGY